MAQVDCDAGEHAMTAAWPRNGSSGRLAQRRRPQRRLRSGRGAAPAAAAIAGNDACLDCGWGRLIFAHTFADRAAVVDLLRNEAPDARDIAFYVSDPQVLLARAPQHLFLDPSHTYRMELSRYRPRPEPVKGFFIRRVRNASDADAANRILAKCGMVRVPSPLFTERRASQTVIYLVAEDERTGAIVGTVTGIDHVRAFNDPLGGTSLWCLAVDPEAPFPFVGEALVRFLLEYFLARGRAHLDLSVMHDNTRAMQLYRRLGFEPVPFFSVKRRNAVNEKLFIGSTPDDALNPYARIIVEEARRRGIEVAVEDEESGLFTLTLGGRRIACRESLSDLTSAVAAARCDDKALTLRLLAKAGLHVPDQVGASSDEHNRHFLERHTRTVVKPARGEQGAGISVDVRDMAELRRAVARAHAQCDRVLLEQYCEGDDLRIVVINHEVVAAAIRRPATVIGDGKTPITGLIAAQSRRRSAASGGESRIPMDSETERCVRLAGFELDAVLPAGAALPVRKTANLHTGGTLHDVTADLHPDLARAAEKASQVLNIPVVGLDFLVPSFTGPDYVIIEANERPGLANHEPQPTAERFIDLLFPQTKDRPQ